MFKPKMVLIDVDGTLVDSVPDLTFCVDEMLKQLDMPVRGEAAVRQWVGNGVQRLTERALTNDLDGYPDAELFARAMPIFMELYAENTSKRSRLYDGVLEGLDFLQSCPGLKIGCVTNKAEQFTLPLLTDLGIVDRFEIIISGDSLPEKKPHPLPLLHAAEKLGVKPEDSVMIGDSKSDVKAARAAGFQIICMTYGYNHGEDIRNYSPDAVIDSMTELASLISA
ncbi:phosphoglycolate phosphatase [Thiothrix subterranea]|uniref:Phosphoglycolate phosphatase n=1 Tax=Thiothrix subterranea TaxID=2735563 RepID=A0AA51QZW5_9GAMM|nr:phosphoglycolate phosphatase [Thiothrix subterranea]MDQ5769333.1 phosphoglycolate phosphatase [Thiothrix subterranea]WML85044.1 phosphoglycolate phosphatase [Thiothrix subterranea]